MLSNAAFQKAEARHLRRQAETVAKDARLARLRALGLTRAELLAIALRETR